MTTLSEVKERLEGVADWALSEGVGGDAIVTAESAFTGSFPADFVEFLKVFGTGPGRSEEFIGLGGERHLDIVDMARHLRQPSTHSSFPSHLVPVRGDGFGNYDCIDLLASNEVRSQLVAWVHDASERESLEVLEDGYWAWFNGILDMVVEDQG